VSHHRRHFLEKLQVQIASVGALAAVYFLIAPALRPWEPGGVIAFVPMGDYGRLAIFAVAVWIISACCAAMTISARPEGSLLATIIGVAGFSFASGPMRMLLWQWDGHFGKLFALLTAEVFAMAAVILGAMAVIRLVRAGMRRSFPKLTWGAPIPAAKTAESQSGKTQAMHAVGAVVMELAIAMLLLVVTFRSTDRGQIAFALAASFFVASVVAHQIFPIRISAPLLLGPILMAVLVFGFGWAGLGGDGNSGWFAAQMVAQNLPLRAALPIDWMTLGTGGAVAGFWLSSRMHEAKPSGPKPQKES
jgi:hypothetical protein